MRDGFAAQGKAQPVAGLAPGYAGSQGWSWWWRRHFPATKAVVLASKEQLNAGRRSKQPAPRASKEKSHASRVEPAHTHGAHPLLQRGDGAGAVQHSSPSSTLMRLLFAVTPKRRSLTSPAEDVTSAVIGREGRVWASQGVVSRTAFLRQPLGKHGSWAQTSFLPRSCLQIRLAQPGCYYC